MIAFVTLDKYLSDKLLVIDRANPEKATFTTQLAKLIAHLGDAVIILPPFIVMMFLHEPYRKLGLYVMINCIVAIIIVMLLKKTVTRDRPPLVAPGFNFSVFHNVDQHSFPSGHAARTFAIGTTCFFLIPILGYFMLGLAVLVCLSRVALGLHYIGDIIVGGIIGWIVALTFTVVIL